MFTRTSAQRFFLVALIISVTAAVVFAARVHYKRGSETFCSITDGTATCGGGVLTGLGNGDLVILVTINGEAATECRNPGNGNLVPGQNPAEGSSTDGDIIDDETFKNGNVALPTVTAGPVDFPDPTAAEAGCPGANWDATVDESNATYSGVFTVSQGGQVINSLTVNF